VLSSVTTVSACLFRQIVYLVCGCNVVCNIMCALEMIIIAFLMHTLYCRQHTATYQINNLTKQISRESSNSTKHERRPPENGQTIVTETCRVLIDVFYKHF
jgi:hypothetical protein